MDGVTCYMKNKKPALIRTGVIIFVATIYLLITQIERINIASIITRINSR